VARLADGWLASGYNTTPSLFAVALQRLRGHLIAAGKDADGFPNAVASTWMFVTEDAAEVDAVLTRVLSPALGRSPEELHQRLPVGPAGECAEKLARLGEAGAQRVIVWPVGDELRQIEVFRERVVAAL
jgi:alkanesulfonate monooxygenase SsuD/methylene tetrahydromethanopterin reductase-like flavin-dependent oxidoreductase (luciferase family)